MERLQKLCAQCALAFDNFYVQFEIEKLDKKIIIIIPVETKGKQSRFTNMSRFLQYGLIKLIPTFKHWINRSDCKKLRSVSKS